MKTLTLLRHAKSSWAESGLSDHDRPLNERGQRDAPLMAERLQSAGIRPSLIISSTAVRAWTTAKIIAQAISYPAEFLVREPDLYHASVNELIGVVSRQETGFNNIMLVGHNPGLTDLANFLVPGTTKNIPTCGVFSVTFDSELWDLHGDITASLKVFDYPKLAD